MAEKVAIRRYGKIEYRGDNVLQRWRGSGGN